MERARVTLDRLNVAGPGPSRECDNLRRQLGDAGRHIGPSATALQRLAEVDYSGVRCPNRSFTPATSIVSPNASFSPSGAIGRPLMHVDVSESIGTSL